MNKATFDAIAARARLAARPALPGEPDMVMICMKGGDIVHPDDLGADMSLSFRQRCEAVAEAVKDRKTLLDFIDEGFDIDWHPTTEESPDAP